MNLTHVTLSAAHGGTHWGVIVNGVAAGATLLLAAVAVGALRAAKRQADEASRAVEEGRRARIDSRSPALFVELDAPDWPPLHPSTIGGTPGQIRAGTVYTIPGQDALPLFVRFRCTLTNYGTIPAKVLVDGTLEPVTNPSVYGGVPLPPEYEVAGPRQSDGDFALGPGERVRLFLVFEQTIGEWRVEPAPDGLSVLRRITVTDQFADGVLDTILVMLQAKPVLADANDSGRFIIRTNQAAGGAVSLYGNGQVAATERTYRRLP